MCEKETGQFQIGEILQLLCTPQEDCQADGRKSTIAKAFVHLMDEMPGGFLIYYADRGEEIVYANQGLLRIFKCDTMEQFRELTGNSFRGIVHPGDLEAVEESIWAQITASQYDLDYVEYRIRCRDGSIRWIEDYGHFVHCGTMGDIFYVFLGDATEKRDRILSEKNQLMNEKLEKERKFQHLTEEYDKERSLIHRKSQRQLEVIEGLSINYATICYVDLDEDQIVPYRLSSRTDIFFDGKFQPKPYSQYAADYVSSWVHPDDRELVAKATSPDYIRGKMEDSQTYYFNYRVLVGDEPKYLQLRIVNVSHQDGAAQVVLGYRRVDEEIQQQMEQQAMLAEALAKANLAINSKNTFLSNMSHDMRTPLHAIFGFTSLAKLNLDNQEEALDYLNRVETASRQLLDMIDKVLEVSSVSGEARVEERECDLEKLLQKTCDFLRPQAQEKDLAFTLDCSGLRHKTVFTDQEKLRQLMTYLGNNAVTYTDPGGQVTVSAVEEGELPNGYATYRLSVRDTGIGISREFLEKVFEPFSREKNSTLSGVHGIGLGLTIAKSIVDMMGGTITAESEEGKGSVFTVTFNLRFQAQPSEGKPAPRKTASSQRILLVEDNELNREIEMELLAKLGFSVDTAENGKAVLEILKTAEPGRYDLILMDLQMPVMDGWQTAVAIRSLPDQALAKLPIIALSANVMHSDLQRSKDSGIDAHLVKPMDLDLLLRTIEELTGKKRPS